MKIILNQGLKSINTNIKYGCNNKNNLKSNVNLYESNNPISMFKLDKKINLLKKLIIMPENFHQLLNKFQYHLMVVIKILRFPKRMVPFSMILDLWLD